MDRKEEQLLGIKGHTQTESSRLHAQTEEILLKFEKVINQTKLIIFKVIID